MKKLLFVLFASVVCVAASGQKIAIKNNILYDVALTPNLGVEVRLGRGMTLDLSGNYNPFKLEECKSWKHWLVQPELRFWTCESFNGTFIGVHALGGEYSFMGFKLPFGLVKGLKDNRYEGYFYGGGISLGHQWVLSKRWSIEATLGVGYARFHYEKYGCGVCDPLQSEGWHNYFGPTKAAVSFIFFL